MVAYFCKVCNNLLLLEVDDRDCISLKCETCPFRGPLDYHVRVVSTRQKKDDPENSFLDINEQRKLIPTTTENCPKCNHPKAYYHQMQTRSADEPMTIFYRCCDPKCNYSWKE
ncbi:DNA-directed RNA polymerase III subunit RPC10 [Coccinella septempunctata]|uniref:DNA-directed RNA polymerase III subunit RPC10 n=1 Tax=Coccinella septempunctata TaxID=41139 RepID=UPI001D0655A1|nr:DNA-directed RNA polymerase III subunit RPC10 [Coccinella septempunctata]